MHNLTNTWNKEVEEGDKIIRKELAVTSVGRKEAGVIGGWWEIRNGQWGLDIRQRNLIWFRT